MTLTRRTFLAQMLAGAGWPLAASLGGRLQAAEASRPDIPYYQDHGWQIGCWTRPWAKEDYRVAFDAVVEAGMKYVALTGAKTDTGRVIAAATPVEQARQVGVEARRRGLEITHVYGGGLPLHRGPDSLQRMIDNASAAGAWSVVLSGLGNEETYERSIRVITDLCDDAEKKQVALVIKPHGGLTGTGPLCRKAIKQIGHRNVSLMYDPGNILYYSEGELDPLEDCQTVEGLVTAISMKDFRPPREVAVTPGTGDIDFETLLARLKRGGFTHGAALIEIVSPGDADHTLREVVRARQFLERTLNAT